MIKLNELFESIREKLDNTKSMEETIRIYNEAILDLDSYGLLGSCTVKQIRKLIIGNFLKTKYICFGDILYNKIQTSDFNGFCLIAGNTDNTYFLPPLSMLLNKLSIIRNNQYGVDIFCFLGWIRAIASIRIPLTFGSGISFGIYETMGYRYYPARGWIRTNGAFGEKYWDDGVYGQISEYQWLYYPDTLYVGVKGFKGIKISEGNSVDDYYFLGFANYVNLGSKHI
jgi:hypothetical protein